MNIDKQPNNNLINDPDRKVTVGQIVAELRQKPTENVSIEQMTEDGLKEYLPSLLKKVREGQGLYPNADFFIEVTTRRHELLGPEVLPQNQFYVRDSCPTPNYDQSVFKYHKDKEDVEYIWSIPDRGSCYLLKNWSNRIKPEQQWLLKFVLEFANGTLYKRMKQLNGEEENSPILVKG